jgi:hypothetical protein
MFCFIFFISCYWSITSYHTLHTQYIQLGPTNYGGPSSHCFTFIQYTVPYKKIQWCLVQIRFHACVNTMIIPSFMIISQFNYETDSTNRIYFGISKVYSVSLIFISSRDTLLFAVTSKQNHTSDPIVKIVASPDIRYVQLLCRTLTEEMGSAFVFTSVYFLALIFILIYVLIVQSFRVFKRVYCIIDSVYC